MQLHALSTGKTPGSYVDSLRSAGFAVHHIAFSTSTGFTHKCWRYCGEFEFDAVHIHTERAALTYAFLARAAGVPTIVRTIHNNFMFRGPARLSRIIRRWAARRLGVVQVSVSDSVQQNESERFLNPTRLIYNWYDPEVFRPPSPGERSAARMALGLSEKEKVLVSVGNCSVIKNHVAILRALALLRTAGVSALYLHVGEEDANGSERQFARDLGLEAQARFVGRQEVRPFLWAADVFVMPSLYEGFSISMLEAAACELMLVLSPSPGLVQWRASFPEIVYADPTPSDLARTLMRALDAPCRNQPIPRGVLQAKFGARRGAQAYLDLYRGSLGIS